MGRYFSAAIDEPSSSPDERNDEKKSPSSAVKKAEEGSSAKKNVLDNLPITFSDISRAEVAIRGGVKRTVCEHSPFISELVGANVYFKPEFRQFTGSFKERGARNAILHLMRREKQDGLKGVIAASAGNHAQALAYHGQQLGVPATVVMPTVAPMSKVDKCRVRWISVHLCCDETCSYLPFVCPFYISEIWSPCYN
jgi:threonine dehydratase